MAEWILEQIEEVKEKYYLAAVGFSAASKINDGGSYDLSSNVPKLFQQLTELIGTPNLRELVKKNFPDLPATVKNDALAGTIAAVVHAYRENLDLQALVYLIDSTGIGGTVWKKENHGIIYPTEVGHVPAVTALNKYGITQFCGVDKYAKYVCLENVGSRGKGVENAMRKAVKSGNFNLQTLLEIYNHSAYVIAHAIDGLVHYFCLPDDLDSAAFALHGGGFRPSGFPERVMQILEKNYKQEGLLTSEKEVPFFTTLQVSPNACLEGAAIAALMEL